jgi:hypothetical protein
MNLAKAKAVQATARAVNDAAQRLQHAVGDDAVLRAAGEYVAARREHIGAVAGAEDPEGGAPVSAPDSG